MIENSVDQKLANTESQNANLKLNSQKKKSAFKMMGMKAFYNKRAQSFMSQRKIVESPVKIPG